MSLGQVSDVNVVPHTSSIRSRVIVPENVQFLSFAHDHLLDEGEQVVRVHIRFISQKTCFVGATWVKISK
jgi:sporulation protein YlmC with PRC-barrel domain